MLPISSSDPRPHVTRLGGSLGLRRLPAELSYVIRTSIRVPLGKTNGAL